MSEYAHYYSDNAETGARAELRTPTENAPGFGTFSGE
jgi:hypothetical protein